MKTSLGIVSALCLTLLGAGCASTSSLSSPPIGPDPTNGRLIKGAVNTTVYYLGPDNKRYVFPTDKTYLSWFKTFKYVKQITDEELIKYPLGGNVTYRPGVRLLKIDTDPKVYAVARAETLRWIESEEVAKQLYGDDWRSQVDDLPDAFFTNYKFGMDIKSASDFSVKDELTTITTIDQDKGLMAASSTMP